jgi:hypothetical protein
LVRASYAEPRETFDVNVIGTARVLDAVRALGRACVVVVSEAAAEIVVSAVVLSRLARSEPWRKAGIGTRRQRRWWRRLGARPHCRRHRSQPQCRTARAGAQSASNSAVATRAGAAGWLSVTGGAHAFYERRESERTPGFMCGACLGDIADYQNGGKPAA